MDSCKYWVIIQHSVLRHPNQPDLQPFWEINGAPLTLFNSCLYFSV